MNAQAVVLPDLADNEKSFFQRRNEVWRLQTVFRIGNLRDQQRVYPLAIGRAANPRRDFRANVLEQFELHRLESPKLPVVRHGETKALETEWMQVLKTDDGLL